MATQYLSKTGLTYLWGRIVALYQPKEAGKGLSTNDLTDELKAQIEKVSGIETQVTNLVNEGGEPNVIETVKVNGTALTPDADKAVDVTVPDTSNMMEYKKRSADDTEPYINTPFYADGTHYILQLQPDRTGGGTTGAYDSLAWKIRNDDANQDSLKLTLPTIDKVNALIAAALAEGIGGVTQFRYLPVDALPATGEAGVIYLVPNSGNAPNIKDEYIWINKGTTETPDYAFELLGTTEMDLSGYLQTTDIEAITTAEIDAITGA